LVASLRNLREDAFLDQQELADRAGVALTTVQRLEAGRTGARRKTARKLAQVLGVDPRDISLNVARPTAN
jgi:DNA-binding XRE family transcriptional regulator